METFVGLRVLISNETRGDYNVRMINVKSSDYPQLLKWQAGCAQSVEIWT